MAALASGRAQAGTQQNIAEGREVREQALSGKKGEPIPREDCGFLMGGKAFGLHWPVPDRVGRDRRRIR